MVWVAGESGNPAGRKPGARNRRTQEILDLIAGRGDKDPLDFLSEYIKSGQDDNLKVAAANILAPYKHSKCGATPPLRFIEEPVELPRPMTLEQANANIAYISELKALGKIDLDFANSLIADNRTIADNIIAEEELKLKLTAAGGGAEQRILIEGGLPDLPGTDVIMPHINGVTGMADLPAQIIDQQVNSGSPAQEAASDNQEINSGSPADASSSDDAPPPSPDPQP